ncbi:MAG: aminotransferase class V-fold PLP-dependent enzyme [Gemmatimonadota bacterium]|nr:aminotransferase class V-fold PLP-dependent enzyme [Gemmatimonadota bacterium]
MTDSIFALLEADAAPDAASLFTEIAARYLARAADGDGPVSTPLAPADIAQRFDEAMPRSGRPLAEITARIERDVLADMNRLAHPMAMGHQVSAPLPAAIWMDSVVSAMNQSLAVNEMSPSATAIERRVIRWMCELAGLGDGAGGTFTSGGTEATFTALLAARARAMPAAWEHGVYGTPPVVLCGEHAHYAVTRAVGQLGLGMQRVIAVPSRDWRMDADALEGRLSALESQGTPVMAVVATAGSTATGAFDDLDVIGKICQARGVWLHVDGAHGASALLSATHKHRLRGIERADSLAWDPHKMMLMPLAAGMLLVREERTLERAFSQDAPYLFHAAGEEGLPDQGTRSFQCSRRADALKLWVALQRYGAEAIGELYDHLCDVTRALHEMVLASSRFETVHEPECNILCFRYAGDGTMDDDTLDGINRDLRERYNRSGHGWITTTIVGGRRVLRVTIMNPRTEARHVAEMLSEVGALGTEH